MAILALEPDPARAKTIRHIVCDVVRAELRLVRSKNNLLKALSSEIPDLMLVPALLSSADEADLLAHLSTLRDSGHLEILVTPFRFASEDQPRVAQSSWRRFWGQPKSPAQESACDPRAFADQLAWSLRRAREVRQERTDRSQWGHATEEVSDTSPPAPVRGADRRAHRRFAANELHGLRAARAVKAIVERCAVGPVRADQLRELSTLLHEVSRWPAVDPGEHSLKEVLGITIAALQRGHKPAVAFMLIEERLDAALPLVSARFALAPALITTADKETLYLNLPASGATTSGVLKVELPRGTMLEDWQFRLLKASTYLAALLGPATTHKPHDRRRDTGVRGRFEGRRVGPIDMKVTIQDISESGCFVHALNEEETGQRLTLALRLPDEGWITVNAEVVSSRPGGFAVQFIDLSEEIRACIARVVTARTESPALEIASMIA